MFGVLIAAAIGLASFAIFAIARDDSSPTDENEDAPSDTSRPEPGDVRDGSTVLERSTRLSITPVDEYRIVYRVDDYAGGTTVTTTEEVRIRRPFDSRVQRSTGAPPGEDVTSVQLTRFGRLAVPTGEDVSLTLDVPPDLAGNDFRFDIGLDDLVADDLMDAREWREVADRPCRVHRVAEPITGSVPTKADAGGDDYADLCIDEDGLLLEELWVTDGRVLRHRLAVEVDDSSGLDDALLADPSSPLSTDQGGGALVALDPASAPQGRSWRLPVAPDGFTLTGRYSVTPPRAGAQPIATPVVSSLVDVWTSGPDIVLLEQGGGEEALPRSDGARSVELDLDAVEKVEAHPGVRMNEIRLYTELGVVRVRGTLAEDALVDLARTLEITTGDGLRPR